MRYLFWILGLFAAAVALTQVVHGSSYILLVYPPYRVELSLVLFIVLALTVFLSFYGLARLATSIMQMTEHVRQYRFKSLQAKKTEILEEVLGAYFEGRYAAAEKAATKAMEAGNASALFPIIAARSAHELREYKKRDKYLLAAENKAIGDSTMQLIAKGKFMLDQHNPQAALNALQKLRDSGVKDHVGAMSLELKAQQQAGNWDEVLSVLDELEKRSSIDSSIAETLRQQAWLEKLSQQNDLAALNRCLRSAPVNIKLNTRVAQAAAIHLIKMGEGSIAQRVIAESLEAHWDSELVELYGDCVTGDVVQLIEQAEKWLKQHKDDKGLLLALGKLCLHQKLWGKAQNYLDASLSIQPSQPAYDALAKLAEQLGKPEEAFSYYRKARSLAK